MGGKNKNKNRKNQRTFFVDTLNEDNPRFPQGPVRGIGKKAVISEAMMIMKRYMFLNTTIDPSTVTIEKTLTIEVASDFDKTLIQRHIVRIKLPKQCFEEV